MDQDKWNELKRKGSAHYKTGGIQPIDLYLAMDPEGFRSWAIFEITSHALRNLVPREKILEDLDKIIHYAELLKAIHGGEK